MATQQIDATRTEEFADRMVGILNDGGLALMVSVGHRTGLFDTMTGLPPSTSQEIADAAGLNERYVREWLGAMVTGDIVEYQPEGELYRLPPEHAASLTRDAAPDNVAAFAQYIGLLGSVEDQVVECFRKGGGVPYSAFPRFQEVMIEDSGQTVVPALLDHILPIVPGLPDRLREGIEVLDVGCGSGKALNIMAKEFPASHFTGYDISEDGLSRARAEAAGLGLTNVRFEAQDAAKLAEKERYDLITTFDAVHDQVDPAAVLKGINRALKPDGVYLMQDIASTGRLEDNKEQQPIAPLLYTISVMHCMTVSLAWGGQGLGTMWGEQKAREMLREAGFANVDVQRLAHDFQNSYYVCRKA
ncbi:MAG: methyltransferase domain-containing protein [Chloroflexota bacterium]